MEMNAQPAYGSYPPAVQEERGLIDLGEIAAVLRRRLWPILAAMAVVIALAAAAYLLSDRVYSATGRVGVDRQVQEVVAVNETRPLVVDSATVDTEVQVITSPDVAAAVVDQLQLARRAGFGFAEGATAPSAEAARSRAINVVRNSLSVQRQGVSYAIIISYSNADPELAAAIVNATIDSYINGTRTARSRSRERETELLRQRLEQMRGDVLAAESAVADYRARTNMADITGDGTASREAISSLNSQLASARAEQAAADARAAASARGTAGSSTADSSIVTELRGEQARLNAELREQSTQLGERHPRIVAARQRLAEVNEAIAAEVSRARATDTSAAAAARQRAQSLQQSINNAQSALLSANNASVRLNELLRDAESSRSLYQALLDRYRENVAATGTEQSNAYVIALASVPGLPTSPSLPAFAVGAIIGGLIAGALAAMLLEMKDRGYRSRSELERGLNIQALSSLPNLNTVKGVTLSDKSPRGPSDYLLANEDSLYAESVRSILTALKVGQVNPAVRSLAITSGLPGEGKTTLSVSLARAAARQGTRVALVDCDIRRRAATRSLIAGEPTGLLDVLKDKAPLDAALLQDEASGAFLLGQGPTTASDYSLLASEKMENLVRQLEGLFDLVILDCAPVLPVAEARAVAAMANGTLLAMKWLKTPAHVGKLAIQELDRAGATIVGAALTLVNMRASASFGTDGYYYKAYEAVSA
ncbi:polysaccharide biosynthesis tyrosine autokinase [Croceibacterium sp. TMG7-5b_MA50]|uniref:GumC family protein n=1 Tax=Croceibacterium sp. TMG7-5b_MA50 TaxID=3121290 RepID=UPI003221B2A1